MGRSRILIATGIGVAIAISTVAVVTHFRLLATEGQEKGNETPQEVAQEVLTGKPAHLVQNETTAGATSNTTGVDPESLETPEQRAAESK